MSRLLIAAVLSFHALAAGAIAMTPPGPPKLPVTSYVLVDYHSGRVLAEFEAGTRVEPASLTKIMTSYVAADALADGSVSLEDVTTVSEKAWRTGGSKMFIEVGKQVKVDDLLSGIIVQSGNDASIALAEYLSGDESVFAAMMNQTAERLGMSGTHFGNSTGLPDPETYTTAHDLATLTRAFIKNHPEVYQRFSIPSFGYNDIKQANRNPLLGKDPSVDGVKTGHTESAGYCLVASAVRDGMRLISVVTGADSDGARAQASKALLNYGFRFYETQRLYAAGTEIVSTPVWMGAASEVQVGVAEDAWLTIPRGALEDLDAEARLNVPLMAPLAVGDMVGDVVFKLNGEEIKRLPAISLAPVARGGIIKRWTDSFWLLFE